ncbi:hypothetical protein RFI_39817, partial [Reticulomyxa filosa]
MLGYDVTLCATIYKSKMKANISKNIKNKIFSFKKVKELRIEQHRNKNKAVVRLTYTEKFSIDLNVVISNQIYKQKVNTYSSKNKKNSKIIIFHIEKKIKKVTPFASFQLLHFNDKQVPPCQMHFHKDFLSCKSDTNSLSSAIKIELLETSDMPATQVENKSCNRM